MTAAHVHDWRCYGRTLCPILLAEIDKKVAETPEETKRVREGLDAYARKPRHTTSWGRTL